MAFVAFMLALLLPAAPAFSVDQGSGFQVAVYANVGTSPDSIPYDRIDSIVLAFVNPTDNCGGFASTTISGAKDIVQMARDHAAKGHPITVSFAVGGGGDQALDARLAAIASTDKCRTQFASQVAKIISVNGLDGVNLDWEFPDTDKPSLDNYTAMVKAIRGAIGNKLLSTAIYNDAGKGEALGLTKGVYPYVDSYMVMAYLAPPNAAIDGWINPPWSLPEDKLQLGLAIFGDPADGGASLPYNQVLGTVPAAQVSPCGDQVGMYGINGLRTTGELTRFAMTEQLAGITGWQLGYDRTDSISLMRAADDVARMWEDFAVWQTGTAFPAGTVIQSDGNLWMVKTPAQTKPSLTNPAYLQYEQVKVFSDQVYYCGGDEMWSSGMVYRADEDPMLSVTDQSPKGDPSLWTQLYNAPLYDSSQTYEKDDRVFFNSSIYSANQTTQGVSPAKSLTNWSPYVDTQAFDPSKSYSKGATVRYMANRYISTKTTKGSTPVVATDAWQLLRK